MISTSLTTERWKLEDGSTAFPYLWNGEVVLIRDDAETVIKVIQLFGDEDIPESDKHDAFLYLFFASPTDAFTACDFDPEDFAELIKKSVWDVCGLDLDGSKPTEDPLWELEIDSDKIRASFRQAYGIEWDEVRSKISFAEFIALIAGCPHETPLGRAIYYRNPKTKPKQTKYNQEAIDTWNKLHSLYTLDRRSRTPDEANVVTEDMFAALKQAAR